MKKRVFLSCLSLLLLLVTASLVACGNKDEGGVVRDPDVFAGTKWENVDFTGTKLRISLSVDQYDNKASIPSSDRYVRGLDNAASDEVVNMVMDRNSKVSQGLGIEIQYIEVHHQFRDVQPYINENVMAANSESPDIFINDCFGTIRAAMDGCLYNVLEQSEKNYFEFTDDHGWYTEYMDGLTLNPAVKYVLAGDYFIDVLRAAHTLYVNIDRYNELMGDIEANLYADIKAGNFTYDYLSELAFLGWDPGPNNKSGRAVVDDDCIGLAADTLASYTFFYTTNVPMYTKNPNGTFTLEYENPLYFTFADDIINLMNEQSVLLTNEVGAPPEKRTSFMFANGNVLLAEGMWISDLENPEIRNMEDRVGVTVYPKQNGNADRYITLIHDIAEIGSIALSTQKFSACTAYLQCSTEESEEMRKKYTEEAVKFKYNKDFATADMIDLIYDSISSPFESVMTRVAFEQVVPFGTSQPGMSNMRDHLNSCIFKNNNTFANNYQSSYNAYDQGMKSLYDRFNPQ